MLKHRKRRPRMSLVGIRHRWVFPHDVHAPDLTGVYGVDDLDDGEALLRIEGLTPEILVLAANIGILDRHVVRVVHRDKPDVRGPLNVVLAAQGMKAGTRPPDLAGDERERDKTARIVGDMNVLRNA